MLKPCRDTWRVSGISVAVTDKRIELRCELMKHHTRKVHHIKYKQKTDD